MADDYEEPKLYEVKVDRQTVGRYERRDDAIAAWRFQKDRNPNRHVSVMDWRGWSVGGV
jgi:hypothetical protein